MEFYYSEDVPHAGLRSILERSARHRHLAREPLLFQKVLHVQDHLTKKDYGQTFKFTGGYDIVKRETYEVSNPYTNELQKRSTVNFWRRMGTNQFSKERIPKSNVSMEKIGILRDRNRREFAFLLKTLHGWLLTVLFGEMDGSDYPEAYSRVVLLSRWVQAFKGWFIDHKFIITLPGFAKEIDWELVDHVEFLWKHNQWKMLDVLRLHVRGLRGLAEVQRIPEFRDEIVVLPNQPQGNPRIAKQGVRDKRRTTHHVGEIILEILRSSVLEGKAKIHATQSSFVKRKVLDILKRKYNITISEHTLRTYLSRLEYTDPERRRSRA